MDVFSRTPERLYIAPHAAWRGSISHYTVCRKLFLIPLTGYLVQGTGCYLLFLFFGFTEVDTPHQVVYACQPCVRGLFWGRSGGYVPRLEVFLFLESGIWAASFWCWTEKQKRNRPLPSKSWSTAFYCTLRTSLCRNSVKRFSTGNAFSNSKFFGAPKSFDYRTASAWIGCW